MPLDMTDYQLRVGRWLRKCFPPDVVKNKTERMDRFLEEALKFVQTNSDYDADRAKRLVDYVFGRPIGDRPQEVGGVMVTLAAACDVYEIGLNVAAWDELQRIERPDVIERIRAKQATKRDIHGPLP